MSRILIVDDAAFMRMMLKDILEKNGYQVIGEASNGLKAIELYKKIDQMLLQWILQCQRWMVLRH